jgi:phage terminase large subunit
MKTSCIFDWNYNSKKFHVVNAGGTSSGKTVSIMQAIGLKLCQKKQTATVVGADIPKLKSGALRDFQNYVLPFIQPYVVEYNKSERIYLFTNGSILEFKSYEDEQSARNGKRDILFVNECNGIVWSIIWQLMIRTSIQCFFDFNPSADFWIYENIIADSERKIDTDYFISDHRHNPFLTTQLRKQIEGIKDKEMYKVYARGQRGKLAGQVYHWTQCEAIAVCNSILWGIDYGYTNDPTGLVKIMYNNNNGYIDAYYVQELLYTPGVSPAGITQIMFANGYVAGQILYSEHDNDMVTQLRTLGISAVFAHKTDLENRILWMKKQTIYYTATSPNIKNEVAKCIWLENKNATNEDNKFLNKRIDSFDHLINAIEYGTYSAFMMHRL